MKYVFMFLITAIAAYTLAMMISYSVTGKPDPRDKFRICWWKEEAE